MVYLIIRTKNQFTLEIKQKSEITVGIQGGGTEHVWIAWNEYGSLQFCKERNNQIEKEYSLFYLKNGWFWMSPCGERGFPKRKFVSFSNKAETIDFVCRCINSGYLIWFLRTFWVTK